MELTRQEKNDLMDKYLSEDKEEYNRKEVYLRRTPLAKLNAIKYKLQKYFPWYPYANLPYIRLSKEWFKS